ncbi:GTP-binding protein [Candidatus Woesearchaeota archaeon]|nr:GTP-binding protein [Candidatus Woesearchaeota archaeon]
MVTYLEEIKQLEDEIRNTDYNKKTQHHIGLVKAKIARLKEKQETRVRSKKKGEGYSVRKSGDASVILLGFPSVGKSTLLNGLTSANSTVAAYAFTTLTVIPGLMEYNFAKIQILDVPGIVEGAAMGTGRGKEVLSVMRNADLVLMLVDVSEPKHLAVLKKEVHDSNIRLNQRKPDVRIKRTARGGIRIGNTVRLTKIDNRTIESILREFKLNNADVLIRTDISDDQLIDVIEGNKVYIPGITVLNKIDMIDKDALNKIMKETNADIAISAEKKTHLDQLKQLIFERLDFIRLFLKEPRKPADMEVPLIMFKGCTIRNVCEKLHKDFVTKFRFARVWGKSARFDGQKILKLEHILQDKDVLELHVK